MDFEEMAFRIARGSDGRATVQMVDSPYGSHAGSSADFPGGEALEELMRRLEFSVRMGGCTLDLIEPSETSANSPPPDAVFGSPEEIGERLFHSLFGGRRMDALLLSLGRAESRPDAGLRIRLILDPAEPALCALPWELLYRPDTQDFFARNPLTPLVRYLEVPRLRAPAPIVEALHILVVVLYPGDEDQIALGEERDRLVTAWKGEGRVTIDFLAAPTLLDLRLQLMRSAYHVVHFMGHGGYDPESGEGCLIFGSSDQASTLVTGRALADALKDNRWLRLVVLNACKTAHMPRLIGQDPFGGVASALLLGGIPAVVAMQQVISDQAAIVFGQYFYSALASGFPVDAAAAEGRLAIHLAEPGTWEWATPALYMSVPDGQILKSEPATETLPEKAENQPSTPPAVRADTQGGSESIVIGGSGHTFQGPIRVSNSRRSDDSAK